MDALDLVRTGRYWSAAIRRDALASWTDSHGHLRISGKHVSIQVCRRVAPSHVCLRYMLTILPTRLFLTILVAMLSNTYTNLARNATAEIQFRRAVLTFEGVKSDSLFAYRPPLNFLALVILLPLKFVLTPRCKLTCSCLLNLKNSLTAAPSKGFTRSTFSRFVSPMRLYWCLSLFTSGSTFGNEPVD